MPDDLQPLLADAASKRDFIRKKTVEGLSDLFPIIGKNTTLELHNVTVKGRDYSSTKQKNALMEGRTLHEPITGTLVLKDANGKTLEEKKNHTLLHLPYFTERHTFIVGGNEYDVPSQMRLKPGVYTRERNNGEFEAAFNLSKGSNFRLSMEPESGKLHMELGTSKIPLYGLLKSMGVPEADIRNYWGAELRDMNASGLKGKEEALVNKIITKIKKRGDIVPATLEGKQEFIRQYFENTGMDPDVNARTLGVPVDKANPIALLTASRKLIRVQKGEETGDDRDSLEFKTIHSVDDFFKERLNVDAKRTIARKVALKLNQGQGKTLKEIVPNSTFTKSINSFITSSALSSIPMQISPLEIIDHASRITSLGEGGISSERSVPYESRKVHNTHLGILDPVRTPECHSADTEVFTSEGWVAWPSVTSDTLFACYVDNKLTFQKAKNLTRSFYTGDLVHFKNRQIDLLVTPNHRIWLIDTDAKHRFEAAETLLTTRVRFVTAPPAQEEGNVPSWELPKIPRKGSRQRTLIIKNWDAWGAFVGWFLSEGHSVHRSKPSAEYRVCIAQDQEINPLNCKKIEECLDKLELRWKYHKSKVYRINHKQLTEYCRSLGKSGEKYIPEYFFTSPLSVRQQLYDALMRGDGTRKKYHSRKGTDTREEYTTISSKLANDVQRLMLTLGYSAHVLKYPGRYIVRKLQRSFSTCHPKKGQITRVFYEGMVYCAEVPGNLLLTRRNKSVPVWSGNSFKAGVDVRASLAAYRDARGNMYSRLKDMRTGKMAYVPATTLAKSTVGFSGQDHRKQWDAIRGNDVVSVAKKEIDYAVPDPTYMFGPTTAMVPLIESMQGNRTIMGSKFQTQALPLVEREAPFVQAAAPRKGQSMEREIARLVVPTAREDGVVVDVDDDYVYVRPDAVKKAADGTVKTAAEQIQKIPYDTYFPLSSKTYLHNDVKVKPGDRVKKDQALANSNFTKDDVMALGKNLSVGYMAYYGKNSNDAVVISEGAAQKLTSEHMYKEVLQKGPDVILGKQKYQAYYGMNFTAEQLGKLDDKGIAKKGVTLNQGDPIILGMRKAPPSPEAAMLGNFHKSLVKPYKDATVTWDKPVPAVVQDTTDAARQIMVTVRTKEPMKIGDKLANRFGGKGVVSEIIPNERMVRDESNEPIDVLFTSAGVVSRINPGQIVEASLGKVVKKTGKPIILPQFMREDNVQYAKKILKENGVKEKETVYDPVSDKKIDNIFVGNSYIHKLFKSTETNYAARGVSNYDINHQPTRGGDAGAKGIGKMEINALLAHNARNVLKEDLTTKSEKSDEFWRAYEFGLPPPAPKTPFVSEKFVAMLQGAGINVDKSGSQVSLGPLTDRDVDKLSSGGLSVPSLEKSKSFMVSAKNMQPEKGGLFDPALTGGLSGTRWAHMDLAEPIVNPIFEEPIRRLLGMTKTQLKEEVGNIGGEGIKARLNSIDLDKKEDELLSLTKTKRGADLDNAVKQLKYIRALRAAGHEKIGDAYTLSKVPVIPPVMRPIMPSQRGNELQVSDINYLYRDVGLASEALRGVASLGLPSATADARHHLHEATGALFGTQRPTSPQLMGREAKGFIEQITGSGSPKHGYLHKKILKRQQDLSGRATATPDNTLNMDQIGIPEDMIWDTYNKFIMRGLVNQGYKPATASEMIEQRQPAAKAILDNEIKKRPVFVNRAPSLHKHNFVAAYPVMVPGKSLRVNPFMEKGQNLDYDGDTMQIHVPVGDKAVEEAQGLTLSNLLFSDKNRDDLMVFPQHEALLGTYIATAKKESGPVKKFKTKADAMAAYRRGEITMNTPVKIGT